MKFLISKKSIGTMTLLMLLLLSAFASTTVLVNAAPRIKNPNVSIDGSGSIELTWKKSGILQTYSSDAYENLGRLDTITFIPTNGHHISYLEINGEEIEPLDEDGFSLFNVKAKNIAVRFVENGGIDDVDPADLDAFPTPNVGLIFDNVLAGGEVTAFTIGLEIPGAISDTWDIRTTAIFDQTINVTLSLTFEDLGIDNPDDVPPLTMWRTEVELGRSDVTLDGKVNGDDVSDVANANPSEDGNLVYEPRLDVNDDGFINSTDVNIVNNYIGIQVWEDIPTEVDVDPVLKIVYVSGVTDRFSWFGVR